MTAWPTALRVGAFVRVVEAAAGQAMVLARGDRDSGIVLLLVLSRDGSARLLESEQDLDGVRKIVARRPEWTTERDLTAYWRDRRRVDPDLWVVEAIVADAERLAAETIWAD